jgi:hypothetical protein
MATHTFFNEGDDDFAPVGFAPDGKLYVEAQHGLDFWAHV